MRHIYANEKESVCHYSWKHKRYTPSKPGRYRDARGSKKRKTANETPSEKIITPSEIVEEHIFVCDQRESLVFEFNAAAKYINVWGHEEKLQEQAFILKYDCESYIILVNNTKKLLFTCCNCSSPSHPETDSWCYHINLFVSLKMISYIGEANLRQIINSRGFNLELIVSFFKNDMINDAGLIFDWMSSFTINSSLSGLIYKDVTAGAIVVYVKRGTLSLSCAFCKTNSCSHLDLISLDPLPTTIEFSAAAQKVMTHAKPLIIFDSLRYIFPMQKDLMLLFYLKKRSDKGDKWPEARFPALRVYPKMPEVCCTKSDIESISECSRALLIIRQAFRMNVHVFSYSCKSCKKQTYYEGFEDGLLNCSNKFLIGLDMLYDLAEQKATNGTATNAWWKAEVRAYSIHKTKISAENINLDELPEILELHAEMEKRLLNYSGYISVLLRLFLGNMDYDRAALVCCENPSKISIDGIVLGVESRIINLLELERPWVQEQNGTLQGVRPNTRATMALMELDSVEKLILANFVQNGISQMQWGSLVENKNSKIYKVLDVYSMFDNRGMKMPRVELINFLKSALKNVCPVTSVMPSSLWSIVEECVQNGEIPFQNQELFVQRSPVLLGFMRLYNSKKYENRFKIEVIHYFQELMLRSKKHFNSSCNNN